MANEQLAAGMPYVELPTGTRIVFEAIDPATGNAVAGVVITAATIAADAPDNVQIVPVSPFVPLFVYGHDNGQAA